jgi:hypothetical protein
VPAAGDAAAGASDQARDNGLPVAPLIELDWRLTATEQAIQLDALIDWVERQSAVTVTSVRPAP